MNFLIAKNKKIDLLEHQCPNCGCNCVAITGKGNPYKSKIHRFFQLQRTDWEYDICCGQCQRVHLIKRNKKEGEQRNDVVRF